MKSKSLYTKKTPVTTNMGTPVTNLTLVLDKLARGENAMAFFGSRLFSWT
jgi:hypothetical protein